MSTTLSAVKPVLFKERKFYIDNPMSMDDVFAVVRTHASIAQAYGILHDYYRGRHVILERTFDDTLWEELISKETDEDLNNINNYLINNKLAVLETKGSSKILKKQQEEAALEESLLLKECEDIKRKLEKMTLNFKVNTGKNGQVFGQISTKQIVEELKKKGFDIDKRKIKLDVPINTLGVTNVKVILHKNVEATLKIHLQK